MRDAVLWGHRARKNGSSIKAEGVIRAVLYVGVIRVSFLESVSIESRLYGCQFKLYDYGRSQSTVFALWEVIGSSEEQSFESNVTRMRGGDSTMDRGHVTYQVEAR